MILASPRRPAFEKRQLLTIGVGCKYHFSSVIPQNEEIKNICINVCQSRHDFVVHGSRNTLHAFFKLVLCPI